MNRIAFQWPTWQSNLDDWIVLKIQTKKKKTSRFILSFINLYSDGTAVLSMQNVSVNFLKYEFEQEHFFFYFTFPKWKKYNKFIIWICFKFFKQQSFVAYQFITEIQLWIQLVSKWIRTILLYYLLRDKKNKVLKARVWENVGKQTWNNYKAIIQWTMTMVW